MTNVDTEDGHMGGKLVTENSSFNPQGATCCSHRGPCSRWLVTAFIQAKERNINPARLYSLWVFVWCWWWFVSLLCVWVHEKLFSKTKDPARKLKFNVSVPDCSSVVKIPSFIPPWMNSLNSTSQVERCRFLYSRSRGVERSWTSGIFVCLLSQKMDLCTEFAFCFTRNTRYHVAGWKHVSSRNIFATAMTKIKKGIS